MSRPSQLKWGACRWITVIAYVPQTKETFPPRSGPRLNYEEFPLRHFSKFVPFTHFPLSGQIQTHVLYWRTKFRMHITLGHMNIDKLSHRNQLTTQKRLYQFTKTWTCSSAQISNLWIGLIRLTGSQFSQQKVYCAVSTQPVLSEWVVWHKQAFV